MTGSDGAFLNRNDRDGVEAGDSSRGEAQSQGFLRNRHVRGDDAGLVRQRGGSKTVGDGGGRRCERRIEALGEECRYDAREDVAGARRRHAGIARQVDVGRPLRRRDDRAMPLEDHGDLVTDREIARQLQAAFLHVVGREARQPRQLSRMRRDDDVDAARGLLRR